MQLYYRNPSSSTTNTKIWRKTETTADSADNQIEHPTKLHGDHGTTIGVGGNKSKERDRKSELVLRSTYQIFEWDRNNSDRNFYNVVRYVPIPLVPWMQERSDVPYGHASMLLLGEGSEAAEPYKKYNKIRPLSIRTLQFDQKVRPLSFRPAKFDLSTATPIIVLQCNNCGFYGQQFFSPLSDNMEEIN